MRDRLTSGTRRAVLGVSTFTAGAFDAVRSWIHGGDVTAMVILVAIALVLLMVIVVPHGRRY
jgi:hypothetical protein